MNRYAKVFICSKKCIKGGLSDCTFALEARRDTRSCCAATQKKSSKSIYGNTILPTPEPFSTVGYIQPVLPEMDIDGFDLCTLGNTATSRGPWGFSSKGAAQRAALKKLCGHKAPETEFLGTILSLEICQSGNTGYR